ncbi:MAG: hypothetical protein AABY22_02195 [Nanoarchaeota archaeon]
MKKITDLKPGGLYRTLHDDISFFLRKDDNGFYVFYSLTIGESWNGLEVFFIDYKIEFEEI